MAEMAAKRGLEDGTSKVHEVQCGPVVFHGHQAYTARPKRLSLNIYSLSYNIYTCAQYIRVVVVLAH